MAETHVISALKAKRAELGGELLVAQAKVDQLKAEIVALDRTLILFDPNAVPHAIRAIVKRPTGKHYRHGAWTQTILSVLRDAGRPVSVREMAEMLAPARGVDVMDNRAMLKLSSRIRSVLKRQRHENVTSEWTEGAILWRVPAEPAD